MSEPTRCPKCGGAMVRGYITNFSLGRPIHPGVISTWVAGMPSETSGWHGGGQVAADRCIPAATFRCGGCGFLESYARPEFATE